MANRLSNCTGHSIESIRFAPECNEWEFLFGPKKQIRVAAAWRLVSDNRILFGWRDHDQKFGRSEPQDGQQFLVRRLDNSKIVSVESPGLPCDLQFTFDNGYRLQILGDSSGYEAWTANIDGAVIVAGPEGDATGFSH